MVSSMEAQTFSSEIVYRAPVEILWQAITSKEAMKEWYFDIPDFELKEGAVFNFFEPGDARAYHHRCVIKEIIPFKKLQHTWTHPSHSEAVTLLTWELFREGNQIRVRLTHSGLEALAAADPAFSKENYEAGWNEILGTSLKHFLER